MSIHIKYYTEHDNKKKNNDIPTPKSEYIEVIQSDEDKKSYSVFLRNAAKQLDNLANRLDQITVSDSLSEHFEIHLNQEININELALDLTNEDSVKKHLVLNYPSLDKTLLPMFSELIVSLNINKTSQEELDFIIDEYIPAIYQTISGSIGRLDMVDEKDLLGLWREILPHYVKLVHKTPKEIAEGISSYKETLESLREAFNNFSTQSLSTPVNNHDC